MVEAETMSTQELNEEEEESLVKAEPPHCPLLAFSHIQRNNNLTLTY